MADKRITELNLHTSPQLSDVIAIVNSGETKKIAYGTLYHDIRDGLVSGSSQITITESQISDLTHTDISSLNTFSGSIQSQVNSLISATSSYLTSETDSQTLSILGDQLSISNGNTVTVPTTDITSLNSFTSSYYIDSSSFDTRIDSLVAASGSGFTTGSTEYEELTLQRVDGTSQLFDLSPRRVRETIINKDSVTIQKGMPVYVSGSTGNASHVYLADASNPNRMPAAYIADQTLNPDEEGRGLLVGFITGVNTSEFSRGDQVWVAPGGGYQNTRPTGSNILVQKLGNVIDSAINGTGVIFGAGRTNDVPNIQQGYMWVGGSDDVAITIPSSSFVSSTNFSTYSSSVDSRITTEKDRIDTILSGANADYDQFVEIVNLINSVDTTNDNAFASFYTSSNNEFNSLQLATASLDTQITNVSASFDTTISTLTFDQLADVQDYTASAIPNGYLPVWNSGSQEWRPGRPDFEQGKTRLFVAASRSNTSAFFFNSQTRTSDTSASPVSDSAFMLISGDLDTITVHLRSSTNVDVTIDIFKNANGTAFSTATSMVTPTTTSLVANTISTITFSGLTINQFDSIHIKVTPSGGGDFYGIVEIV